MTYGLSALDWEIDGMFEIFLTDELVPETDLGVAAVYGRIHVGQFSETFVTSLVSWDRRQYEQHWADSLGRLLSGADRSALITSFVTPQLSDHLVWWPLYREGDAVHVQNQLLFYDQLGAPFFPSSPWSSVGERNTVNAEGRRISEWQTDVNSIRAFLERRGRK
jgi:hypothetical protein